MLSFGNIGSYGSEHLMQNWKKTADCLCSAIPIIIYQGAAQNVAAELFDKLQHIQKKNQWEIFWIVHFILHIPYNIWNVF